MARNTTDISTRAFIIALKSPIVHKTTAEIAAITGLSTRTINHIYARAIDRGFDPNIIPFQIKDEWVEDAPRSGRPTKQIEETVNSILDKVRRDRYGREKTCADLAGDLSEDGIDISATTVWRILREAGFQKTKPTRKPGLTKRMKDERLQWCLEHEDWTLEDWKNVIWTDETSVVLLHKRGGYRVWRKTDEAFVRSCIRERWKGYSEFMFWGSFSYDKKGPCHCWIPETKKEKETAEKVLEELNEMLEPIKKREWELEVYMERMKLDANKRGPKPKWKWNEKNGKLTRRKGDGIDWYRYQTVILLTKLFPFAKECQKDHPNTVVQEDKAPSHNHRDQQRVYDLYQIQRLLWCPNSPDLNAIEACWPYMKRATTKKGAPKSRKEAILAWEKCWKELPQEKIQAWIERIPTHIKKIIELDGGNEYREGRDHIRGLNQIRPYGGVEL